MAEKIYHIVNGERVPKPGNKRDPNRRYGSVCNVQTGESYHLEFTPEEEAARDEEEAKWETERPKREAEQREQQRKAAEFRDSLIYEPRIVAFLDVLGWSKAVEKSINDPELVKVLGVSLQTLLAHQSMVDWQMEHGGPDGWPGDPQVAQFSDSIVISAQPDRTGLDFLKMSLYTICGNFLANGFLVRGGIAIGNLYHQGRTVFGPGLIDAYNLERTANYPRIILQPELADSFGQGEKYLNKDGSIAGYAKTWRRCHTDGLSFFDYLQPILTGPHIDLSGDHLRACLLPARDLAEIGLKEFKNDLRIHQKYEWFAKYLNSVIDEYPQAEMEKIKLDS